MDRAKVAAQDALQTFMKLIYNPVGALPDAYSALPGQKAIAVGIVFCVAFTLCMVFAGGTIISALTGGFGSMGSMGFKGFLLVLFTSLAFGAGVGIGNYLARLAFKGQGAVSFDVFLGGATLLPIGIGALVSSLLGLIGIGGIIGQLPAMVGACLGILVLFTGLNRIAGIKEGPSSYLVAAVLTVGGFCAYLVARMLVSVLF